MKINIVIDLEMCHVHQRRRDYPHKNETIQIGAVMLNESWEPMGRFSTFVAPIEKLRRKQQNPEPLTMSLGSLLQGIVLESA